MTPIYQQVASKLGLSEEQVKEVGEHSFAWLRLKMTTLDLIHDKVLYTGLGTFKLLHSKMKKSIDRCVNLSKSDKEKTIKLLEKFNKL